MSVLRSIRPAASALRAAARTATVSRAVLRPAAVQAARVPAQNARNFTASRTARGSGEVDVALASRLQEEIQYENDNAPPGGKEEPDFLKDFKKEGVWEIQEKDSHTEVELVRKFGNETIKVMFSIADIDTDGPQFDTEGEEAEEAEESEETPSSYAVRSTVTITKPDQGALAIDTLVEDGSFVIDSVSFYKDAKAATEMTAQAAFDREGMYVGPQFDHLDINVQEEFEKFLAERGVTDELAMFIPEFAEYKEQKEYVKWLGRVKSFIEA